MFAGPIATAAERESFALVTSNMNDPHFIYSINS